jgi:hypothetical protein
MADTDWTTKEATVAMFSHVGNNKILFEKTIASAATIAPTTYHTILTGTEQVVTITIPYVGFSGTLAFTFTNASPGAFTTAGNLLVAIQPVQYKTLLLTYSQQTGKWYGSYS